MFKRRDATCLLEGKDMFIFDHIWVLALTMLLFSFALIFWPYLLLISHARFRGSKTSKGRKSLILLHIFTFGDMSNPMWYLVLTLYMSSQSWYSCGFFCLLWLVGVSVLSNLVYAGSFHPKPTQDHKVSICITVMWMRISCWCTYCLQEGLMSMKVHFSYFHHLLWCI